MSKRLSCPFSRQYFHVQPSAEEGETGGRWKVLLFSAPPSFARGQVSMSTVERSLKSSLGHFLILKKKWKPFKKKSSFKTLC